VRAPKSKAKRIWTRTQEVATIHNSTK
jgi:hypothetical protein